MDTWYATTLDIQRVLRGATEGDTHIFEADDGRILDCILGRLWLPEWFRRTYFWYHADVRLRFKLAAGLGEEEREKERPSEHGVHCGAVCALVHVSC